WEAWRWERRKGGETVGAGAAGNRRACTSVAQSAKCSYRWAAPPVVLLTPVRRSVDAQRFRDALCKRLHDARSVEDHGDRDSKDNELHEADDLPGKQEEQGHDTDDPQEQRAEEAVEVRHQAGRVK